MSDTLSAVAVPIVARLGRPADLRRRRAGWLHGLSVVLAMACSSLSGSPVIASPLPFAESEEDVGELTSSTFANGLEFPWGMEFMPDGRLLVTERVGRLRVIDPDSDEPPRAVQGLPLVDRRGHGGLLDVTIDPGFASNRLIYLSYTEARRSRNTVRNGLTVARARLSKDGGRLSHVKVLFRQYPRSVSTENLGGRLAVSPDGFLFITIGDRHSGSSRARAQELAAYHGKTLRIRTDGSVPSDNPFVKRRGARPEIWSLGHRNPQGAFVHPETGSLWTAEHGPYGGDEVNIILPGMNYGWPVVTHGCEYDTCAPIGEGSSKSGMHEPLVHWDRPSIAPSNLILYTGEAVPQWKGSVLIGALAGQAVWRLQLSGYGKAAQVVRRERLFAELGERIRDLRQGPDGALYLLTDGDSARVVRVARQVRPPEQWSTEEALSHADHDTAIEP